MSDDKEYKDPDNSLMLILVFCLLLRSCFGCETRSVEKKVEQLNAKIDSMRVVKEMK